MIDTTDAYLAFKGQNKETLQMFVDILKQIANGYKNKSEETEDSPHFWIGFIKEGINYEK